MKLHEPDVTLTDLGLAFECALFVVLLVGNDVDIGNLAAWFCAFFAATGLAAFLGAVTHGFIPDQNSALYRVLWLGIFAAIGIAAVASWVIGAQLILGDAGVRIVLIGALVALVVYMVAVIKVSQSFAVPIIYYLPSAVFLLGAFSLAFYRNPEQHLAFGILGVLFTLVAALVQQLKVKLHPRYFDHNAFYHIIQAIALLLIFLAARAPTLPTPCEVQPCQQL
jgi:hypothetical protein